MDGGAALDTNGMGISVTIIRNHSTIIFSTDREMIPVGRRNTQGMTIGKAHPVFFFAESNLTSVSVD